MENNALDALANCHSNSRNIRFQSCAFRDNFFGQINAYGWQTSGGAAFADCTGLESSGS